MTPVPGQASDDQAAFERFVAEAGPRLGRALTALYGFEDGRGNPRRPRRAILAAAAATAALAIAATVIAVTSDVPKELGVKPSPFPRHPRLKLITERFWVPVGKMCGPVYKRSTSANGKTAIQTFSGESCPGIGSLNDPTYRLLQTLPTNPHTLLALIYRVEHGHGPGPDQEAFVTIGDLLRTTIAPPKVAAALYRAAALIPGVTLIPHATDAIGRPGVAVGRTGPGIGGGIREELIFSRATWQLIGERTVIARTGTTTGATAIIGRAFAGHYGQIPHAA